MAAEGWPPDSATEAMARYLKGRQRADGSWLNFGSRPPIESSDFETTAVAMRALQIYMPKSQQAVYGKSVQLAADWIARAQPVTTEDRVFQLLGLVWAGGRQEIAPRSPRFAAGAAVRRWMEPNRFAFERRLRHRPGTVRAERSGFVELLRCPVQERRTISDEPADGRRIVVCPEPHHPFSALLRCRFPLRTRSVHFGRGDQLGDTSARASRPVNPQLWLFPGNGR